MDELRLLKKAVEEIVPEMELIKKLARSKKTGKPLIIKYGIDPTGADVHIGHLVPIRKMRQFQDLGHTGVIILADFTAQIGDPTGRDITRPPLSKQQILKNSEKYMEQLYTVLDESKTEVHYQSEWFGNMNLEMVLKLAGRFTLAQFMAHDTFRKRYQQGLSLGMHELMYPILQAYDSVAIKADVELGATEQKFNLLQGRILQQYFGQEQQVAMMSPILLGTDGINKMSKSLNNYIGVLDTPNEKYGKVMSIPDNLIINYFTYATNAEETEIKKIEVRLKDSKTNPKAIKQDLARQIVSIYHGQKAALEAQEEFNSVFSKGNTPQEIPKFKLSSPIWIVKLLTDASLCKSSSEARRMISQNAVSINGHKVSDIETIIDTQGIVKVGKRRFLEIVK